MPTALITGASRGLGAALTRELVDLGWTVVADARDGDALRGAHAPATDERALELLPGDVTDPVHREALARAVARRGGLDLLVNNASALGPSPLPRLDHLDTDELTDIVRTNLVAPHALIRALLAQLRRSTAGTIVNVSSDAAVEPYAGWGGYGASKAGLDHLTRVLAAEEPALAVYAFDPGDMRTAMHQAAFPGEDISDRPPPEAVVPALLALVHRRPPSGRYQASDLLAPIGGVL
jgi:NAD(P)-dependent dehydrogenase (short-subunit alcohol dehydrogenase family)